MIASHVFFGPIPMNENSSRLPFTFRLATALLETGAGRGGNFGAAASSSPLAQMSSRKALIFFIIR